MKRIKKYGFFFLMGLASILLLVLLFLNLPFTQRHATNKVNQILFRSSVPIHLDAIRKILPGSVRIQGISIIGSRSDTLIYCGELHADIRLLSLMRNKVILKDLELDAARVELERLGGAANINIAEAFGGGKNRELPPTERAAPPWLISIKKGSLSNIHFRMNDSLGGLHILQDAAEIALENFRISLVDKQISCRSIFLGEAKGEISLTESPIPPKKKKADPWKLGFRILEVENTDLSFSKAADSIALETRLGKADIRASEFDLPAKVIHMNRIDLEKCLFAMEGIGVFRDLEMNVDDLSYDQKLTGLGIRKLAFDMDRGISLSKLSGRLDSEEDLTDLQVEIRTAHSQIKMKAFTRGTFEDLLAAPAELSRAGLELSSSYISLDEITGLMPRFGEEPIYKALADSPVRLSGQGDLENGSLRISDLQAWQEDNYTITVEGLIQNPFQLAEATGKLQVEVSGLGQSWMDSLAVASGFSGPVPDLRGSGLQAHISDSLLSPEVRITIESPLGSGTVEGSVDFGREQYGLAYEIRDLSLGELLPVPGLGAFSGKGELKGKGFSMDALQASYYIHVDTLDYKAYPYSNSQLTGTLRPGAYDLQLVAMDPALKADLQVELALGDSAHIAEASGILQAQLDELHLVVEPLMLQSSIEAQLIHSPNGMEVELSCRDLSLGRSEKVAQVQELKAELRTDSMQSVFHADADFFKADLALWRPLDELDALGKGYQHYFESFRNASHITAANRLSYLPEIQASVSMQDHELLDLLLGDSSLIFDSLDGSISKLANQNSLHARIKGEGLAYKSLETQYLSAVLSDSAGIIDMDLRADSASVFAGSDQRIVLQASSSKGELLADIAVRDQRDQARYRLNLHGRVDSNRIAITVPDQEIILNTEVWELDTPELLSIYLSDNILLPTLSMKSGPSSLKLGARYQDPHITYDLDLQRVELSSLLSNDQLKGIPEGTITGSLGFQTGRDVDKRLEAELFVDHLRFSGEDLSGIEVDAEFSRTADGAYGMQLLARLDSLDLQLGGEGDEGGLRRMSGTIKHFPLVMLDPFIKTHVSELGGSISGNFHLASRQGEDHLNGELLFHDVQLMINLLNTRFRIPDQGISIIEERAEFKDFTVLDSLDKPLSVDGYMDFSNPKSPMVNLHISSEHMQVMTRKERSTAPFTGNVFVDSRITLTGPLSRPSVGGNIGLSEGTEIFYHHMEEMRMTETEKIVNFAAPADPEYEIEAPALSVAGNLGSSSIGTLIRVDPRTRINFTLGKRMFDIDLDVKGGGDIQYSLENDQMALSGRYEIGEGSALLKLVGWPNKTFRLAEGGFIRWDGMVENPELNLEAENRISTSYVNPIDGRNRDIDFSVILSLRGYLSDLNVMFTIRTSDQYVMGVINTLSPEEQMRQALSVLLFEAIDLPGISSSTNYMTQQVNQILSAQLNQFTQSTIKGVDISFGLDTYDESGLQGNGDMTTSLSYEVSKTFMNNRAQIEFSGRLKDANQASASSDHSLNNLSFEYTLDSAATKYLKIYNEHNYDDVFEGEVIQTGIGFKFTRRYKTFKDIWRRER